MEVKGLTSVGNAGVMGQWTARPRNAVARGTDEMNDKGNNGGPPRSRRPATQLVTAGRDPRSNHGFVNPPVYHASTVLYPNAEDYVAHRSRYQYGRRGTPTTEALEQALQELEGPQCAGVSLLPSGLAAISTAFLSVVEAGDHVLVTDSAYGPTRNFCEQVLKRLGVTTSYYDPVIGARSPTNSSPTRASSMSKRRAR